MYRMYCERLAERIGKPKAEVIERWSERAAIREYDGGQPRNDAERDAFEEIRAELEG